jgi:hypothetical protein
MGIRPMAEDDEKTVGESLTALVGIVPSVTAAMSFMVLILAFVQEWAFYWVIGGQYQSLVSITDYFNSAIGWLPWAVIGFMTALAWTLVDPMQQIPEDVKAEFYKTHRVRWFMDRAPMWFIFWFGLLGGIFQLLLGDWYTRGFLELLSIYVWLRTFRTILARRSMVEVLNKDVAYLLLFAPLFISTAYFGGLAEGAGALAPKIEANARSQRHDYRRPDHVSSWQRCIYVEYPHRCSGERHHALPRRSL